MNKEKAIIDEFNKDVETVAAIYAKWGAGGLADILHTMAQSKAAAEEILTKAVMTPDEQRKTANYYYESAGVVHVGRKPDVVSVKEILQTLAATRTISGANSAKLRVEASGTSPDRDSI